MNKTYKALSIADADIPLPMSRAQFWKWTGLVFAVAALVPLIVIVYFGFEFIDQQALSIGRLREISLFSAVFLLYFAAVPFAFTGFVALLPAGLNYGFQYSSFGDAMVFWLITLVGFSLILVLFEWGLMMFVTYGI